MKNANKKLLMLALVGAAACSSSSSNGPSGPAEQRTTGDVGVDIVLAPGNSVDVASANLHIKFEKVAQDSRCPTNATILCLWVGSAQAVFKVSRLVGDGETAIALETALSPNSATLYGQLITLVRVDPPRLYIEPIPAEAYRAVVRVGAPK